MFRTLTLAALIMAYLTVLTSCNKDSGGNLGLSPYTGLSPNDPPPIAVPADGAGSFTIATVTTESNFYHGYIDCGILVNVVKYPNPDSGYRNFTYGIVSAQFPADGLLLFGNDTLEYLTSSCGNGSYISLPSPSLSGTPPTAWTINGQLSTDTLLPPVVSPIASADTVQTTGSYTLRCNGPVFGDGIVFAISGSKGTLITALGPGLNAYTFSAAQMATLGATNGANPGLVQIASYRMYNKYIGGKKYYFVKEASFSKYVVLI